VPDKLLVIVDADTLAGWRRPTSSLAQLHQAVADLRRQAPDAVVAVIADPSLKWALSDVERELVEDDIVNGDLLFAPAGCADGHVGFLLRVVEKAEKRGYHAVAITDQVVPGTPIARVRKDGTRWVFDLADAAPTAVVASVRAGGRRRRR